MFSKILGKRKNFIINPAFQWKLIRLSVLLSIVTSSIYLGSNIFFFERLRAMGVKQGLPADATYFSFIEQQQATMNIIFLVSTLLAVILIVGFGIYISHRIAGPIYRMNKHLENAEEGKLLPVHFRKNDFFPELAESFNQFCKRLGLSKSE